MNKMMEFFKKETVFSISLILAIISCFFVLPSANYLNYINIETIILLFAVMLIVEILKNLSVFEILAHKLSNKIRNTHELVLFLVFACFFTSIFLTNDVSLIVFIPFTLLTLKKLNRTDLIILTVTLETIAANVGCMILPIGAPHNIVLYTTSHIPFESFFLILMPYIIVSVLFLIVLSFLTPKDSVSLETPIKKEINKKDFFKRVFSGIDYYLLLTFIALFILIGNLENIPLLSRLFSKWILGNEVIFTILSSQIISNVPASILLTRFSTNYKAIIIGVNIGGFGTLIASMANLISYKILIKEYREFKLKYLLVFSILNLILLACLFGLYIIKLNKLL